MIAVQKQDEAGINLRNVKMTQMSFDIFQRLQCDGAMVLSFCLLTTAENKIPSEARIYGTNYPSVLIELKEGGNLGAIVPWSSQCADQARTNSVAAAVTSQVA
jgi:hypothetical protein